MTLRSEPDRSLQYNVTLNWHHYLPFTLNQNENHILQTMKSCAPAFTTYETFLSHLQMLGIILVWLYLSCACHVVDLKSFVFRHSRKNICVTHCLLVICIAISKRNLKYMRLEEFHRKDQESK